MELWALMHFVMPNVFNNREAFGSVYKCVRVPAGGGSNGCLAVSTRTRCAKRQAAAAPHAPWLTPG